ALDQLLLRVRFNKAIDLEPSNLGAFSVVGPNGVVPTDVSIVNNDALLIVQPEHGLSVGDAVEVVVEAGVKSVKPLIDGVTVTAFELEQRQRFPFVFRGARPNDVSVDSVVPRQLPMASAQTVTVSGLGIPTDISRVRAFL